MKKNKIKIKYIFLELEPSQFEKRFDAKLRNLFIKIFTNPRA